MVAVFARLKWRLVVNRLRRTSGSSRVRLIVGWSLAILVLIAAAFGLALLRTVPDAARITITALYTLQFVAWGLSPIVAFGVDETVEPGKFALLPLTPRTLQTGLLVTAVVGYLPVANVLVLIGASIGLSTHWWMLVPALVCAGVQLLLCVLFSRALSSAMGGLMSSRRGRDIGLLAGFFVFVAYFAINFALNSASGPAALATGAKSSASVLGWLPLGGLAQLPGRLAAGDWGGVLITAVEVIALSAGLWFWWAATLRTSLTTVPSTTESSAPAHQTRGTDVARSLFGTARLVGRRDLVLTWRDPMRRMTLMMIVLLAIAWPLIVIRGHYAVLGVLFPTWLIGAGVANAYGWDGSALWLQLVAYADRMRARGEILGHAIGALIPGTVIVVLAEVFLVAIKDDWHILPGATGLILSALLGATATAGLLATTFPQAVRQSRRTMFASSIPGQKGRAAAATFLTLAGELVIGIPAGVCLVLSIVVNPVWGWIGLVVGVVVGLAAMWVFSSVAARRYLERGPEILAAVSAGDRL